MKILRKLLNKIPKKKEKDNPFSIFEDINSSCKHKKKLMQQYLSGKIIKIENLETING